MACRSRTTLCYVLLAMLLAGCAGTQAAAIAAPTPEAPAPTATNSSPVTEVRPELDKYFQDSTGAFVLYDLNANRYIRYNPERCAARFIPASTFKIMNSLIGLETGVIPDQDYRIRWDGTKYDIPAWNQDHTLKTALASSVVWYFQELARQVGRDKMQSYVAAASYGNRDISGRIDSFWLDGELRISADEQVEFLRRLYLGELPFSPRSMNIVKDILVLDKSESYTFSGKTGSGQRLTPHVGWFVGYLETKGNAYLFATNYASSDPDGVANGESAKNKSRSILQGLGLLF